MLRKEGIHEQEASDNFIHFFIWSSILGAKPQASNTNP